MPVLPSPKTPMPVTIETFPPKLNLHSISPLFVYIVKLAIKWDKPFKFEDNLKYFDYLKKGGGGLNFI